jgi:hypothetical protein
LDHTIVTELAKLRRQTRERNLAIRTIKTGWQKAWSWSKANDLLLPLLLYAVPRRLFRHFAFEESYRSNVRFRTKTAKSAHIPPGINHSFV